MQLSIIIVNYNVQHFLEQCLLSVQKAINGLAVEVYVVDNNSKDASCTMVKEKFPWVILIENKDNPGFAKANNQAMRVAKGQYFILLNPDTVVQENTFSSCIAYMDAHPKVGGLGVNMIDGKGEFLPESKRGLPTPMVAFYKIFGLSALFPQSKIFGKYHLGYLSPSENHEIDVLSGAFMLMRKTTLDICGLLDEAFFMYGEDIDLSYRIQQAGFENHYFADTSIIHYKGESTKKSSVNYVFVFYKAMAIFARKHFSQQNAKVFSFLINIAIYLRASMSLGVRFIKVILIPGIDAAVLYAGMFWLKNYWELNHKYVKAYPTEFMTIMVPIYIAIWLIGTYINGGYDKPMRTSKILKGIFVGTLAISVIYAFLPDEYRFSRALIVLGAFWGAIALSGLRWLYTLVKINGLGLDHNSAMARTIIIGNHTDSQAIQLLMPSNNAQTELIGTISTNDEASDFYLGKIADLQQIIDVYKINEIVFSAKSISMQETMALMQTLKNKDIDFKIAPENASFVIGSNSIHSQGQWYAVDLSFEINKTINQRNKKIFDLAASVVLLLLSPFICLKNKNLSILKNIYEVLTLQKSWVGYAEMNGSADNKLPKLKTGIFTPIFSKQYTLQNKDIQILNKLYAQHYTVEQDVLVLWKNIIA